MPPGVCRQRGRPQLLLGAVEPGVHDERGRAPRRAGRRIVIPRQRRALVRDRKGLGITLEEGQSRPEAGPGLAGQLADPRIGWVTVQVELGRAVVVRRPQVRLACAHHVTAFPAPVGHPVHPPCCRQPLRGPAAEVAGRDARRGRQHLPGLSVTAGCRTEQPKCLEVELGIIEYDAHCRLAAHED